MHRRKSQLGDLGNSTSLIIHPEISSGCESAGVSPRGLLKFLWLPQNTRTPKNSYLQAILVKHAVLSRV